MLCVGDNGKSHTLKSCFKNHFIFMFLESLFDNYVLNYRSLIYFMAHKSWFEIYI